MLKAVLPGPILTVFNGDDVMDLDSQINSLKKRAKMIPDMVENTFRPLASNGATAETVRGVEDFATKCFFYALTAFEVFRELSPNEHAPKDWLDSLTDLKKLISETSSEIKTIRSEWRDAKKQPTRREQTATIGKANDLLHHHMVETFLIYCDMDSTRTDWFNAINDFHQGRRKNFKRGARDNEQSGNHTYTRGSRARTKGT